MMVMMMVVVMMGVNDHHDLRLCRKRVCETHKENEPEPKLFHI